MFSIYYILFFFIYPSCLVLFFKVLNDIKFAVYKNKSLIWNISLFGALDDVNRLNPFFGILINSIVLWIINLPLPFLFIIPFNVNHGQ